MNDNLHITTVMNSQADSQNFQFKPLSESNVVVTGGSRDIGGGIVLELSKAGARVEAIFRKHEQRAQKIAEEVKKSGNQEPIFIQADLTSPEGLETVFNSWKEKFGNKVDILVLCASGSTIEINVDANMALIDKYLSLRQEQIKKGETLTPGTIIFLQSEPGHYHRVIDGVFDFLEYYRTKVGPAKRAGEDALRSRLAKMQEANVRAVVVCPPEVTDTFNMKLFEMQDLEARDKSRELSAMLGTKPYVTISEVAAKVKKILEDPEVLNGHIELFEGISDGLTTLSAIYGDEAIYVHTFKKLGENKGVGRIIVNPSLWKRQDEPSFLGEIKNRSQNQLITSLTMKKEHMLGHFKEDLSPIFPGHKSIRTAALSLGQFLDKDKVELENLRLRKYQSVKFRSPVLPGQTLTTKVTLTNPPPFIKGGSGGISSVVGNAAQSVNDKETMDIRGMVVEFVKDGEKSALLLDQLIESAAQTVGMQVLVNLGSEDLLPLFHSTGEAEIFENVRPGDNLLIKAMNVKISKSGSMNIFSADFKITRALIESVSEKGEKFSKVTKEELIATIKSLQGLLLPKEEVLKKLL